MMFKQLSVTTLGALALGVMSVNASAMPVSFGAANDYNVFVKNNFSATSSDVEGRVAAGGDVSISHYSINIKQGQQLYTDTTNHPALVVGGDLDFTSGQIAGDVYVGGSYTGNSTATVTNGSVQQGGASPIDFTSAFASLEQLSLDLSALPATGTTSPLWSSTQRYFGAGQNGQGSDFHVFDLSSTDMLYTDYLLSGVDVDDFVIFNVSGSAVTTSWGNFWGSDGSIADMSSQVLYNFYEADTLQINAAIAGSILAPTADILAPHGLIEGQVIAKSWTGNTQVNDNPYSTITSVYEPGSLGLLSLGLVAVTILRRRA